jgi:hypothetical protein
LGDGSGGCEGEQQREENHAAEDRGLGESVGSVCGLPS